MTQGITTSIRLPPDLNQDLEKAVQKLHRGKNWIITQALQMYLSKLSKKNLVSEARRQSILASRADKQKYSVWEDNSDTSGWN